MNDDSNAEKVYKALAQLGIEYTVVNHPPVYTVEEAEKHWQHIAGAHCKNLFIRNKKGNHHYLLILEASRSADLKALISLLGEDRLSFASPERLMKYLGLLQGSVSPFGLINDLNREVQVVIDKALTEAERVNFHPNENTATVGLSFKNFDKFLKWCGNPVRYVEF
ncbi:MAG: prolyl-tRNA synthetase associated domain-containing protein [Vulcanimicrobiota bacterium]